MSLVLLRTNYFLIILFCLKALETFSQLSPGELANVHKDLEGNFNCTKCHVLGEKVSNDKCLACHVEIKTRVNQKKGYHSHPEVANKSCTVCHSDHHGRNFQIIKFDVQKFDHKKTGYTLYGKHAQTDCKACHQSANIQEQQLKSKSRTYLGLNTNCISCHDDYHQGSLSADCSTCHNFEAFVPASKFNHNKTDFPLLGKHERVDCKACHSVGTKSGRSFQKFDNISHEDCSSCHANPHYKNFGKCRECHTELSFQSTSKLNQFNHTTTGFELLGKHKSISCGSCHQMNRNISSLFSDHPNIKKSDCIQCHKDVHESRFGINCGNCHNEKGFKQQFVNFNQFDHHLTDFALEGKHESIDCRKCHKASFLDPLPFAKCTDCHTDYHQGQFNISRPNSDCADCHNVQGFKGSSFTAEDHKLSAFPLEGAHIAVPCFECHLKNQQWEFRNLGVKCADCHQDIHFGTLDQKFYPQKNCTNCHKVNAWKEIIFDHALTGYILEGRHLDVECTVCHKATDQHSEIKFKGISTSCLNCHPDYHSGQFYSDKELNVCLKCHTFINWFPDKFEHNSTRFPLEGKHAEIECKACHKPKEINGSVTISYIFESIECISCHH